MSPRVQYHYIIPESLVVTAVAQKWLLRPQLLSIVVYIEIVPA